MQAMCAPQTEPIEHGGLPYEFWHTPCLFLGCASKAKKWRESSGHLGGPESAWAQLGLNFQTQDRALIGRA